MNDAQAYAYVRRALKAYPREQTHDAAARVLKRMDAAPTRADKPHSKRWHCKRAACECILARKRDWSIDRSLVWHVAMMLGARP